MKSFETIVEELPMPFSPELMTELFGGIVAVLLSSGAAKIEGPQVEQPGLPLSSAKEKANFTLVIGGTMRIVLSTQAVLALGWLHDFAKEKEWMK